MYKQKKIFTAFFELWTSRRLLHNFLQATYKLITTSHSLSMYTPQLSIERQERQFPTGNGIRTIGAQYTENEWNIGGCCLSFFPASESKDLPAELTTASDFAQEGPESKKLARIGSSSARIIRGRGCRVRRGKRAKQAATYSAMTVTRVPQHNLNTLAILMCRVCCSPPPSTMRLKPHKNAKFFSCCAHICTAPETASARIFSTEHLEKKKKKKCKTSSLWCMQEMESVEHTIQSSFRWQRRRKRDLRIEARRRRSQTTSLSRAEQCSANWS